MRKVHRICWTPAISELTACKTGVNIMDDQVYTFDNVKFRMLIYPDGKNKKNENIKLCIKVTLSSNIKSITLFTKFLCTTKQIEYYKTKTISSKNRKNTHGWPSKIMSRNILNYNKPLKFECHFEILSIEYHTVNHIHLPYYYASIKMNRFISYQWKLNETQIRKFGTESINHSMIFSPLFGCFVIECSPKIPSKNDKKSSSKSVFAVKLLALPCTLSAVDIKCEFRINYDDEVVHKVNQHTKVEYEENMVIVCTKNIMNRINISSSNLKSMTVSVQIMVNKIFDKNGQDIVDENDDWFNNGVIDCDDNKSQLHDRDFGKITKSRSIQSQIDQLADNQSEMMSNYDDMMNNFANFKQTTEEQFDAINNKLNRLTKSIIYDVNNKITRIKDHQFVDINTIRKELISLKSSTTATVEFVNEFQNVSEINAIKRWLCNNVKLPQYVDNLLTNGYDAFDILIEIKHKSELNEIDIKLKGHQLKILSEIVKLRDIKRKTKFKSWQCSLYCK